MPKNDTLKSQILKLAKEKLGSLEAARQTSDIYKQIEEQRKRTEMASGERVPWIREYYKLYTKQESNPDLAIGRMAKEMDAIVIRQGVLIKAAELCEDERLKEELLKESEELKNHKALKDYEKYTKGLQYIVGEKEELEEEVSLFFRNELGSRITTQGFFKNDRTRSIHELKETESELDVTFMENVAVCKAQQVYALEGTQYYQAMIDQFLGDWPTSQRPKETQYRDRMTPGLICIAYMLKEGWSAEEILDPTKLVEEKKQVGRIYREKREANDLSWLAEQMTAGSEALMGAALKYMKDHRKELKNSQDMTFHANRLGLLVHYCFDMSQEVQYCLKSDKNKLPFQEFTGKSLEDMDKLAERLNVIGSLNNWAVANKIPHNLSFAQRDNVSNIVTEQMRLQHLLEVIGSEKTDIEGDFLDMEQQNQLKWQVFSMPEMDVVFDQELNRTEESIKLLSNMVNGNIIKEKQLHFEVPEYTVSVKNPIIDEVGTVQIPAKQKVSLALVKEGKQVMATDVPVKMGAFLKDLESKKANFRGKAKDNSKEFNQLIKIYDEVVKRMSGEDISYEEKLQELAKIKEAASSYMEAKRKQKGHTSKDIPDFTVDRQMLGLEKGGKSIFTSRGKQRYGFAERLVGNAIKMEKAIQEAIMNKEQKQLQETLKEKEQEKGAETKEQSTEIKMSEKEELQKTETELDSEEMMK